MGNSYGALKMADTNGPDGMLTLVCLTCGKEMFFDVKPPAHSVCPKCGETVFRSFFTPTVPDEATLAMLEETRRSITLGDGSPDTTAGDLRDLNNP
jgi:DNA-directed RNA polymerase subunit RPC12/RpoP